MEARPNPPTVNNNRPPHAAFKRMHYDAITHIMRGVKADIGFESFDKVVSHFNHYFRATQDEYNPTKFLAGCYNKSDDQQID